MTEHGFIDSSGAVVEPGRTDKQAQRWAEIPSPIHEAAFLLPATYFIAILRRVVLRGADFADLFPWVAGLTICCFVILMLSIARFRKQLS